MNVELLLELLALAERFLGHRHAAALAPEHELAGANPLVLGLLERFGLPLAAASLPLLRAAVEQSHWAPFAKQLLLALIDAAAKALPTK